MILTPHGESELNVVAGTMLTDPSIRDPKLTQKGCSARRSDHHRAAGVQRRA